MISRSIISLRSSIIVIIITINIVVVVVVVSAHRRENNAFFHSNVRNFAFRTILAGYVFGQIRNTSSDRYCYFRPIFQFSNSILERFHALVARRG